MLGDDGIHDHILASDIMSSIKAYTTSFSKEPPLPLCRDAYSKLVVVQFTVVGKMPVVYVYTLASKYKSNK